MSMPSNPPLDLIDETILQTLVSNKVAEGKKIEYKQALPGNSDSEKKEFLADVSSFANAIGGDLIFGVEEEASANEITQKLVMLDGELRKRPSAS
jgi:predicted HTH transcriptional regulator